jgi:hypothetical protein
MKRKEGGILLKNLMEHGNVRLGKRGSVVVIVIFIRGGTNSADSDLEILTLPACSSSSNCFFVSKACSLVNLRCFAFGSFAPSRILIAKSKGPWSDNCYFCLQNTSVNSSSSFGSLSRTSCSLLS